VPAADEPERDRRPVPAAAGVGQLWTLTNFVIKNKCLHAEIIWTMKVVKAHYSYNSCTDISETFQSMFPDSAIAKQFTCG
jgi:hypothetical protein